MKESHFFPLSVLKISENKWTQWCRVAVPLDGSESSPRACLYQAWVAGEGQGVGCILYLGVSSSLVGAETLDLGDPASPPSWREWAGQLLPEGPGRKEQKNGTGYTHHLGRTGSTHD